MGLQCVVRMRPRLGGTTEYDFDSLVERNRLRERTCSLRQLLGCHKPTCAVLWSIISTRNESWSQTLEPMRMSAHKR